MNDMMGFLLTEKVFRLAALGKTIFDGMTESFRITCQEFFHKFGIILFKKYGSKNSNATGA